MIITFQVQNPAIAASFAIVISVAVSFLHYLITKAKRLKINDYVIIEELYLSKLISIEEAVELIQSDSDIIVAQCASEPQGCMSKFHLVKERVSEVKVFSVLMLKAYDF